MQLQWTGQSGLVIILSTYFHWRTSLTHCCRMITPWVWLPRFWTGISGCSDLQSLLAASLASIQWWALSGGICVAEWTISHVHFTHKAQPRDTSLDLVSTALFLATHRYLMMHTFFTISHGPTHWLTVQTSRVNKLCRCWQHCRAPTTIPPWSKPTQPIKPMHQQDDQSVPHQQCIEVLPN